MQRPSLRLCAVVLAAGLSAPFAGAQQPARPHWIATWSPSASSMPARPAAGAPDPVPTYVNHTLREIVHTTLGGDSVRIRISNEYGDRPITIGDARVALRADGAATKPGTDRALTFGGRPAVTIGAGATVTSDPIAYDVPQLADLAISLYFPDSARTSTRHLLGLQTNYVSASGDVAESAAFPSDTSLDQWIFLTGVDVTNPSAAGAVVAFGNSITDGYHSTPDADRRWPDDLARRLLTTPGAPVLSVVNAGISGNRVLNPGAGPSALARFDRDVLDEPGVRYVIILEGINDIGRANFSKDAADSVSAADDDFRTSATGGADARPGRGGLRRHADALPGARTLCVLLGGVGSHSGFGERVDPDGRRVRWCHRFRCGDTRFEPPGAFSPGVRWRPSPPERRGIRGDGGLDRSRTLPCVAGPSLASRPSMKFRNKTVSVLIDVRSRLEFLFGHMPGAICIPATKISGDVLERRGIARDAGILVYCASGSRSAGAVQVLRRAGYTRAVDGGGLAEVKKHLRAE